MSRHLARQLSEARIGWSTVRRGHRVAARLHSAQPVRVRAASSMLGYDVFNAQKVDPAKARLATSSRICGTSTREYGRASEYKRPRDVELADLERGMEEYDWRRPTFPLSSTAPRLVYISSKYDTTLDAELHKLMQRPADTDAHEPIVLGFDMEWKANFGMGITPAESRTALMQICSRSLVVILHLAHIVPYASGTLPPLPPALETILRRPAILKTGVQIEGAANKLQKEFRQHDEMSSSSSAGTGTSVGIQSCGLLELSRLARQVDPERWGHHGRRLISLRELVAVYLGRKLVKDGARVSDWSQRKLTPEQVRYAASDVMSGLEVYEALRRRAAMRNGEGGQLPPLRTRRTFEAIMEERQQAQIDSSSAEGQVESEESWTTAVAGEGNGSEDEAADDYTTAAESDDSEDTDPVADSALADAAQSSMQASPSPFFDFAEAVRLATTHLTASPKAARPKAKPARKSSDSSAKSSSSTVRKAHQRTFDMWVYGAGDADGIDPSWRAPKMWFHEIADRNQVQLSTVAGYVMQAFLEKRHIQFPAEVQEAMKQRLMFEFQAPELKPTFRRFKSWLLRECT